MINFEDNIQDDELRILGKPTEPVELQVPMPPRKPKRRWWFIALAVLAALVAVTWVVIARYSKPAQDVYESELAAGQPNSTVAPLERLGNYSDSKKAYVEVINLIINDIPLDIYIPHNAEPRLSIGTPNSNKNKNVIFTTQAADIRADNCKINGAFVLAGEPIAWGLSKKGYCAMIDGKIMVGMANNTPLFEEATEKEGYFFRQYPLVANGRLIESGPKGKAVRKALCDRAGEIFVAMSQTQESFHDFSQALVDLGVTNAIYLVGGESNGFYTGSDGKRVVITEPRDKDKRYKNENHIQWVK